MSITKQKQSTTYNSPSIFALLVDDIRNMNEVEQKQLWLQLNQQSLAAEAKELDDGVTFNTLSEEAIYSLVKEARKNGPGKKKS